MRDGAERESGGPPPSLLWSTLIIGGLVALLQAVGLLGQADQWLAARLVELHSAPDRSTAPLVLAIDEPAVEALGPPPWSPATWAELARGLARAGFEEVYLVDPWTRLVDPTAPPATDPQGARLLVPTMVQARGGTLSSLEPPEELAPLSPWPHQLQLPTHGDGVVRDLSRAARAGDLFGPHALCAWAACPDAEPGHLPLRTLDPPSALPTLSLARVASGERVPAPEELQRTTLVGITAPFLAQPTRVGARALPLTWPEAVAHAVATSRSAAPLAALGLAARISVLLALLLAITLLSEVVRSLRSGPLAYTPLVVVAVAGPALVLTGVALPPLTGSVLVALAPPLLRRMTSRQLALDFLGRAALLLAEDGFRHAWRDTRVRSVEELVVRLGALTRNHTSTDRMAWLHRVDGGNQLELIGGFGVQRDQVHEAGLSLSAAPFRLGRTRPEGSDASELLEGGLRGRVVPLWQRSTLVGFWLVVYSPDQTPTDPSVLAHLAGWMGLRLDLPLSAPRLRHRLGDQLGAETALVQRLFTAASEERRRQVQALHAVELPLLTADMGGTIQFVNHTMAACLADNKLDRHATLRGILFEIMEGGAAFQEQMHLLFAAGDTLRITWNAARERTWRVVAQPVRDSADPQGEVLGYVMHLEDLSHLVKLKEVRSSVVTFASSRVRNALMVIGGYARLMRQVTELEDDREMLDSVLAQVRDITDSLQELQGVVGLDEDEDRVLELDLSRVLQEVSREVLPGAEQRRLTIVLEIPSFALPVLAPPSRLRVALAALLREACATASPGTRLVLSMQDQEDHSQVCLRWRGAGLDPAVLRSCQGAWHEDPSVLPAELLPYARVRHILENLHLSSAPGEGIAATFTLRRGKGASGA